MEVQATQTTFPGFNIDQLNGFARYAADNPADVALGIEARSIWEGHAGHSLAKIGPWSLAGQTIEKPTREYTIPFGAWKEVTEAIGDERAMDKIEPVEAALAAVCSCVTWAICISAAREGITFDSLEVSARGELDPRVLLGMLPVEEVSACLEEIEMEIRVGGDVAPVDLARITEMAKRSPVHALISHANTVNTTIVAA